MRVLKIAAFVLLTSTFIYSQPSKKNITSAGGVPQAQDLAYPTAGYLPPRIPLERALKIAKGFIKRNRIDISSCHLISAKWVVDETRTKNGGWRFLWAHPNELAIALRLRPDRGPTTRWTGAAGAFKQGQRGIISRRPVNSDVMPPNERVKQLRQPSELYLLA